MRMPKYSDDIEDSTVMRFYDWLFLESALLSYKTSDWPKIVFITFIAIVSMW